jgi:hypothetical protein
MERVFPELITVRAGAVARFNATGPGWKPPPRPTGDEATKRKAYPPVDQLGRAVEQPKLRESRHALGRICRFIRQHTKRRVGDAAGMSAY